MLTVTIETKLLLLPWARSGCSHNCSYWVYYVCFVHVPFCYQHLIIVCSLSVPAVCLRILIQVSVFVMPKGLKVCSCFVWFCVLGCYWGDIMTFPRAIYFFILTENLPESKSRYLRTKYVIQWRYCILAKCPVWTSNSTWDVSRGGFPFFHSGTSHSIFHVNYKILSSVWLMQNEWGPSCVISWYIFKITNTLAPLWRLGLRHIPCPHVIISLGPTQDPCLTPSHISFSPPLLHFLHTTWLEMHQKWH